MKDFTDEDLKCPKKAICTCVDCCKKTNYEEKQAVKNSTYNVTRLKKEVHAPKNLIMIYLIMHLKGTNRISDACEFNLEVGNTA